MIRTLAILTAALICITATADPVDISVTTTGGAVRAHLDWQAIPGQTYSVHTAPSLLPAAWTNATVPGLTASNVLGQYVTTVTNRTQFFRIVKEDTDPPRVEDLIPAADAIAIQSSATVSIVLDDETGIDTDSIMVSVGPWTDLTLGSEMLTYSNGTLSFFPTGTLGTAGGVVSNELTVADVLGHTLNNYTWTFQLARAAVVTNTFIPLTAPPPGKGPQTLSIGGVMRTRSLPGVAPLDGTDEYHIIAVTSNSVLFSYTTTPPTVTNGTLLVSFDAAYPFYREVVSNTLNEADLEITAWTIDISLTNLLDEGSISSLSFVPAQTGKGATASGDLNLLHVEYGDDLSGTVLYEDAGLKLHLPSASWDFAGDVDVAFDMSWGELRSLDASATGTLTLDMTPEVLFYQAISGGDSVPLVAPVTHLFGGMVGPVPVWVEVTMELNAGYTYSASVNGDAHATLGAEKEMTFSVYLREDEWSHGFDNPPIVKYYDPIVWNIEGEANTKVYIQPKLTVLFYSLAGLWADIQPYGEIAGEFQADPLEYQYGLYLGVSSTLGIESRMPGLPTPEWELFEQKWPLWNDAYPDYTAPAFVSSFPDRSVEEGDSVVLSGYAAGDPVPSYRWYYNGTQITGETEPEYSISPAHSGHEGTYTVQAYNGPGSVQTSCVVNVTADDGTSQLAPSNMVLIPAGSFQMGDNHGDGHDDELPVHEVYINAFHIDQYEVTNDELVEVLNWAYAEGKLNVSSLSVSNAMGDSQELLDLDDNDCMIAWNGVEFEMKDAKGAGYPCVEVTWYGAVAYCNFRTQMEEGIRTSCYNLSDWTCSWSATGYRLPTEAEWEKAARGGMIGQRFPWGANISHDHANYRADGAAFIYDDSPYFNPTYHPDYDDDYPYTSPVGDFPPNDCELYDMTGNVWEWCWDWYDSLYYNSSPGEDPRGPSEGTYRVSRGGSWSGNADDCRNSNRYHSYGLPNGSYGSIGFRTVVPAGQ